jgi:acyl-CoA dehydrogenase
MLADMVKDIEAARLLVWKAAWLADEGIRNSKEAAIAKAFAADMAMQVTTDAVQIYGGMGYTKWHPVEKLMRDAKVIQIYEDSPDHEAIIAGSCQEPGILQRKRKKGSLGVLLNQEEFHQIPG